MAVRRWLGDTLLSAGLVTRPQLDEAVAIQNSTGQRLGQALVSLGHISPAALLQVLCSEAGIPYLNESALHPQADVVGLFPADLAQAHAAVPLRIEGRHLIVAMADPFDLLAIRELTRAAGRSVRVVGAPREAVLDAIRSAYESAAAVPLAAAVGAPAPPRLEVARADVVPINRQARDSGYTAEERAEAERAFDEILRKALELGATDVHIEPLDDAVRVRFRVDGLLGDALALARASLPPLVRHLEGLAALDVTNARVPQHGRARLTLDDRPIDVRVSAFPTLHGVDLVLRVLDRARVALNLDSLGLDADDLVLLRMALHRPRGLIPVSGPSGSGRTTTLYAALMSLDASDRAIITLEDPIEYEVPLIRQSQVDTRAGLTFASGLRSLLRHDPNVILLGEIPDSDTLRLALNAASTGHLVLTSMNATTTAGMIGRLSEMGAEPFDVATAVSLFVCQRLVRVLCPSCKAKVELPVPVRRRFGLEDAVLYGPRGCDECRNTGFKGRTGIFELLPMSADVAAAIQQRIPADQIQRDSGRPTLLMDGARKVRTGITSLDEVLRVSA